MNRKIIVGLSVVLAVIAVLAVFGRNRSAAREINSESAQIADRRDRAKPDPIAAVDRKGEQTAVFAGGCFWGLEAVFEHIKGVNDVTSGYSGGAAETADYETISSGETGHAESVKITFDPAQVSYEKLLEAFFAAAHDPTELNRQGPDTGTQYRSAIFYSHDEQKQFAETLVAELTKDKTYSRPVVTQIVSLKTFYKAEDYHQNYLARHPNQPYIVAHDQPKVENLQKQFPALYVSK